jgi:bacteriorhodopsin
MLVGAVVILLVGFVGLVDANSHYDRMWPWWLIGLIGLLLVLVAIGNPWRRPDGS